MRIEHISFKPTASLQSTQVTSRPTAKHALHTLSSMQSLSIHEKGASKFFTCIQRFFEMLCKPFQWLYNLLFPSSAPKVPKIPVSITASQEPAAEKSIAAVTQPILTPSVPVPSKFPTCIFKSDIVPNAHPEQIMHPNKRTAYDFLMKKQYLEQPAHFYKYELPNKDYLQGCPLFQWAKEIVYFERGSMPYGNSTEEDIRWVAHFADNHVMRNCQGPKFTESEVQVAEHPVLYHVKRYLMRTGQAYMEENQVYLLRNVPYMGKIDIFTPIAPGRPTLYGNAFAEATQQDIDTRTYRIPQPKASNIFFIAAPTIGADTTGPYQKAHLEQLFYTAYTAFYGIKEQSAPANCHVHTGNWGVETQGHSATVSHLIQLAAARAAVISLHVHPQNKKVNLLAAQAILDEIELQNPNVSIDQFLTHLAENAIHYKLFYGKSKET